MTLESIEELQAHLMQNDEAFRHMAEEHQVCKTKVQELEAKATLSLDEEMEEHRLKKRKLFLKDQMADLLQRARSA
jgi:uncharacterized protein YdcH (DUF465 family)